MNKDLRGKYKLEHSQYIKTKQLIRSYPSIVEEYQEILHASPANDGQPHGKGISDTTGQKAIKLAELSKKIIAIERASEKIPQEYRRAIFNHIAFRKPYNLPANISTIRRWQYKFIFYVYKILEEQ